MFGIVTDDVTLTPMLDSTALLTDHYELTMVRAAMRSGAAFRPSVFELFPRRLPTGRRYGVVAGVGRALESVETFTFDEPTIDWLLAHDVVDQPLADWLADYRFTGSIWGYPEGEVYFPGSPLMIVEGSFAEAVILETVLLSIYNYDSAVASAASRMTAMAGERPCIEMGSRRTNEIAAVAAARAAFVAGFAATSNLEAGRRYGVPTRGTAAHSFTLLHASEAEAFEAQLRALGEATTLLVDTYDIEAAVRTGVELTNGRLGAVRLDGPERRARRQQARVTTHVGGFLRAPRGQRFAEARIGEVLVPVQPFRATRLLVVHDDAAAHGDGEPFAVRVPQPGRHALVDHLAVVALQDAGLLRTGEARRVHGDEDVGGAVRALGADARHQLVGIGLDGADADARRAGERLIELRVGVVVPRRVDVDLRLLLLRLRLLLLLLLGCIMDMAPLILITTPILLPVVKSIGMDPVHFGIVLMLNLGIGLLTPPVGSTLFVGCAIGGVTIEKLSKTLLPFYAVMIGVLMVITYIPSIVMFLPRLMLG